MSVPTSTKNNYLNGQGYDFTSLHTGYPGTTGANEASGGAPAYARKAITVSAASGGSRLLSGTAVFDVPAGTYSWFGFWLSGVFVDAIPNGGAIPKNFVALAADDKVYCPAHGYANATKIVFYHGTPPVPFTQGTTYFVRDAAADTFKVAATAGGAAIDITVNSLYACVLAEIIEQAHGSQGTHTLTQYSNGLPD